MSNWPGIMKVLDMTVVTADGRVRLHKQNLHNLLHTGGEQLFLQALFVGGNATNAYIPTNYYFGLDNRSSISIADTMASISTEPSGNNYARVPISSYGIFTVSLYNGIYQATSPVLTYSASGGDFSEVRNLFLTNKIDSTGVLISTVILNEPITVYNGETLNLKMGLLLRDCS